MGKANLRAIQKLNKKNQQDSYVAKLMQAKETKGFGFTFTNKRIALFIWNRVFVLWARK